MTEGRDSSNGSRAINIAWACAFLAILFLPLVLMPFESNRVRETEKRTAAPMPSFIEYEKFAKAFEAWFDDRFGLRSILISSYRQVLFELGLSSSGTRKAIRGVDNWHYFSGGGLEDTILDFKGAVRFSADELDRLETYFREWNQWLSDRGIEFHVMIAPNKVSIYPEFLPRGIKQGPSEKRIGPLLKRLASSELSPVFPREKILKRKSDEHDLYFKWDTHWNGIGAFFGYRVFFEESGLDRPLPEANVRFLRSLRDHGDLARLLGITNDERDVDYEIRLSEGHWAKPLGDWKFAHGQQNRFEMKSATLGKALVFHDSFMGPLIPLFARHFRSSAFYFEPYLDKEAIETEMPDIVILEFAERLAHGLLEGPLP
jgi:hypothetical protein